MKKQTLFVLVFMTAVSLACLVGGGASEPKAAVAPIELSKGIASLDICAVIPTEDIEAVMGRKLTSKPESFDYYGESGANGCTYDAGKDSSGAAYFGYVVFTSIETYKNQPLYNNKDVKDLGQNAYFNNGADARQLWVKVNDSTAFVVAFGDEPRESGTLALARLVLAAIK